ncbi:MAG: hypothetical protein ACI81T_002045 [Bacteroidia bacterium]|jgi:hypothetical protein
MIISEFSVILSKSCVQFVHPLFMIFSIFKYILVLVFLVSATSGTMAQSKKGNKTNKAVKSKKKKKKEEKNSDKKENKGSNKSFNQVKKRRNRKTQDVNRQDLHFKKKSEKTDKGNSTSDKFSTTSSYRSKKPRTVPDETGMIGKKRKQDELKRYHNSDKLKTAPVPPRERKPNSDDTYMVKRKRTHGKEGLPNKNPIMIDIGSKRDNKTKNPRPEISRWTGEYKMPRPFIQRYIESKKRRDMQDGSKLKIVRVMNDRKQYRKLGRKPAMWTGNLKVKKLPKHAHPSLRYQFRKYKPTSAEIARNKKVKKLKYDPNEKKIWEPKEEHSTTY